MSDVVITTIAVAVVALTLAGFIVATRRRRPEVRPAPEEARARGPVVETTPPADEAVVERAPADQARRPSLPERLAKSRRWLADRLGDVFSGAPDDDTWDDLEAVLIQADVGVDIATRVTGDLKDQAGERKLTEARDLKALLADELVSLFDQEHDRALGFAPQGPTVWLVVGVNGVGKTTTIGKLARDLSERKKTVALAAADTFRAAADEQLAIWGERTGASVVRHQPGADPAAVAFDAVQHATAKRIDVLLVDTAGRLHTKTPLMDELAKVKRVIEKQAPVQEVLLVIDATAGQNGLVQSREFAGATGVTGVLLTKLDGSARGGIALAIESTLGIPIKLIGVGEGADDLEAFDPRSFVDALLS